MSFEKYDKIIESIEATLLGASYREAQLPVSISNVYIPKNVLLQSRRGGMWVGPDKQFLSNDDFYFVPLGQQANVWYGQSTSYRAVTDEEASHLQDMTEVFRPITSAEVQTSRRETVSVTTFFSMVHGSIPLFQAMELPCLLIPYNRRLTNMINSMIEESTGNRLGRAAFIQSLLKEVIITLCRFVYENKEYNKYFENLVFLADPRLLEIIKYIQNNLDKELSNEKIAHVANISKDYVGQFFKSITKRNLQDYIETRRLERAHFILRTAGGNIQEISKKVGFKDQAYFSKRFKMMFNENAKDVRKIRIPNP